MALAVFSTPAAWSQQWDPGAPGTFVQGQTYRYSLVIPALADFLAGEIDVSYPASIFEPFSILPAELGLLLANNGQPLPGQVDNSNPPKPLPSKVLDVFLPPAPVVTGEMTKIDLKIWMCLRNECPVPTDFGVSIPAGKLFDVDFRVKDGAGVPLGELAPGLRPSASFRFDLGDPLHANILTESSLSGESSIAGNVVAIPEPATWAMLLAGLSVIGAAVMRSRRRTSHAQCAAGIPPQ